VDEGPDGQDPAAGDPAQIGGYQVLRRLGAGGMGTVYLAEARGDRPVAIKLVHQHLASDAEFRARFASEAAAGRRVPAFCSARVLESGDHEGRPYLVAEYIDGTSLSTLVAEEGALDLPALHALAVGTAAGLAAIHGAGLVHRDVKPSNIMMALGGVRIIDFGIARALEDTGGFTRTGIVMGSLGWAAPEQLSGDRPTTAMDIFGWGCVIGYAATGQHPFGTSVDTRAWRVLHAEPHLDGVPFPLRPLVASALSRNPSDRPTATELLLSLVAATPGELAPRPVHTGRAPRRATSTLAVALPLTLALVVGAAGATSLEYGDPVPPGPHATTSPHGDRPPPAVTGGPDGGKGGGPVVDQGGSAARTPVPTPTGAAAPTPTGQQAGGSPAPTLPARSRTPKSRIPKDPTSSAPSPSG
jgi:serine/threonine protein kinase